MRASSERAFSAESVEAAPELDFLAAVAICSFEQGDEEESSTNRDWHGTDVENRRD